MNADARLAALALHAGILPQYEDMQRQVCVTSVETQRALLTALGIAAQDDAAVTASLKKIDDLAKHRMFPEEVIIESSQQCRLPFGEGTTWTLVEDDTLDVVASGRADTEILLPALQSGVYELSVLGQGHTEIVRILAAPRRLVSVEALTGVNRVWGINLALYALESDRNSGIGDFQDLADVAGMAGQVGAAFVGVNPIHSMGFVDTSISPYSPSHRGFLNTTHIALDTIPGLDGSAKARSVLTRNAGEMDSLRRSSDVQHQPHKAMVNRLLDSLYRAFDQEAPAHVQNLFRAFVDIAGAELEKFATYETISEQQGPDWRDWDETDQADANPDRVQFHKWLQWVATVQLDNAQNKAKSADLALGLYLDLAVGPRRSGAESWCERACIAQGVSIGAPPDHLSPEGQNWDLAAFAPRHLQKANYRPLRRILSQIMRHAGVVRIDHVLGLTRSFLIPDNGAPGGYVTQPLESLIAIIKIESERHNCAVIGEDLGLVPDTFRETMRDHGFYGYSVVQYEKDNEGQFRNPAQGNTQVLSCFATHDTPTVKGYETGRDIDWWQRLGWIDERAAQGARQERVGDIEQLKGIAGTGTDFQSSISAILAGSAACMVSIQLDDILGTTEAQNLPGTIQEHPNWRRKCGLKVGQLSANQGMIDLSTTMRTARPTNKESKE